MSIADKAWERGRRLGSNGWIAVFTVVLTIATVGSFWAMYWQNNIMLKQMGQTDDTLDITRLSQGALLVVTPPITGPVEDGAATLVNVVVKNKGKLPAIVSKFKFKLFPGPIGGDVNNELASKDGWKPIEGSMIIAPDEPTTMGLGHAPIRLPARRTELKYGDPTLFVCVDVEYADLLGNVGYTRSLFFYAPADQLFMSEPNYSVMDLQRPKRGNE